MIHAAGDPGFPAWANTVDAALASNAGAVAAEVSARSTADAASVVTAAPSTVSAIQFMLQKIKTGVEDVKILCLGDSIDIGLAQWYGQLGYWLGTQWPAYTFVYYHWDDPTQAWVTYPLTTGTGARTVRVYNGAVGGMNTSYPLGDRLEKLVGLTQPDLVLIAYLANETDDTVARASHFRDRYAAVTESVLATAPQAGIVVCGKPGKPLTPNSVEYRSVALRDLARAKGFGYIDFYGAFVATDPNWATTLISTVDQVHPTVAGQTVMFEEAKRHFTYRRGVQTMTQPVSSLTEPVKNLLINGDFADWTGAFPASWLDLYSPSPRSTAAKNVALFETGTWSAKLTPTVTSVPEVTIYQVVNVRRFRGQWVTLAARVRVDPTQANRVALGHTTLYVVDGAGATVHESSSTVGTPDGFAWVVNSLRIPPDATTLQCWLSTRSTGTGAAEASWDRAVLAPGILPRDMIA